MPARRRGEYLAYSVLYQRAQPAAWTSITRSPAGARSVLRLEADGLKLLKRKILIPNAMLLCKNINTFL
jgi:ethylbenzene dioxygenase beta subunit